MTYTETSIGELEAISRSRELTAAESAELARLLKQQKQNDARRRRYRNDPAYRAQRNSHTPEQLRRCADARRERAASDPAYRARRNAQAR